MIHNSDRNIPQTASYSGDGACSQFHIRVENDYTSWWFRLSWVFSSSLIDWFIDWVKGFTSHSTQNSRRSSQPIAWLGTEETKTNTTKASNEEINWSKLTKNTHNAQPRQTQKTKSKPKPTHKFKNSSHMCVHIIVHNYQRIVIFSPNLQTIIKAQMLSVEGRKSSSFFDFRGNWHCILYNGLLRPRNCSGVWITALWSRRKTTGTTRRLTSSIWKQSGNVDKIRRKSCCRRQL